MLETFQSSFSFQFKALSRPFVLYLQYVNHFLGSRHDPLLSLFSIHHCSALAYSALHLAKLRIVSLQPLKCSIWPCPVSALPFSHRTRQIYLCGPEIDIQTNREGQTKASLFMELCDLYAKKAEEEASLLHPIVYNRNQPQRQNSRRMQF